VRQPALKFASKAKRQQPEAQLQKRIVQWLRMTAMPGVLFFSVPNEGRRSVVLGTHFKAMGLRPGVADLVIIVKGRASFLELKHGSNIITSEQSSFGHEAIFASCNYEVAYTLDEALAHLRAWGAIRPDSGRRAA
jgi:hypothetical protein